VPEPLPLYLEEGDPLDAGPDCDEEDVLFGLLKSLLPHREGVPRGGRGAGGWGSATLALRKLLCSSSASDGRPSGLPVHGTFRECYRYDTLFPMVSPFDQISEIGSRDLFTSNRIATV